MKRLLCTLGLLASLSGCGDESSVSVLNGGSASGPCPDNISWDFDRTSTELQSSVYRFAKSQIGNQIKRGECAELASEALVRVGAKKHSELGRTGPDADYVWGKEMVNVTPGDVSGTIRPGMIIQFRGARFEGKRGSGTYTQTANHHTAIVSAVSKNNKHICVLHQNSGGVRTVQYGYYKLNDLKKGWMKFYSPIRK